MSTEDVFAIAKRYLRKVKRSGPENIMAICPFHRRADGHEERTPSFTMSLTRGLFYCFSCHERGTLQKFLRDVGIPRSRIDLEYGELLTELDKYRPPPANPLKPQRIVDEPLEESFLGIFDMCPMVLLEEGFSEETLRTFDIGFDQKHERITFPLRDSQGTLIGFSGRSVDGSWPRYKVYDTEYEAWGLPTRKTRKAGLLWNCHRVLPELYFTNDADLVVVEGFKACMWLHQAGISPVVALLGSFLSRDQQWLIERMGAEVYLMLDNDEAGSNGTKLVARTLSRSLRVHVVEYDAPQPSDLSPDGIYEALSNATPFHKWKIQQSTNRNLSI